MKDDCIFCGEKNIIVKSFYLNKEFVNKLCPGKNIFIGKQHHICYVCWNRAFVCSDGLKFTKEEKVKIMKRLEMEDKK